MVVCVCLRVNELASKLRSDSRDLHNGKTGVSLYVSYRSGSEAPFDRKSF